MRRMFAALAASVCIAAPASADTIGVLRANTLVLHAADGKIQTILVKDGIELEQVNTKGVWARGFWAIEGGNFCWTARGESRACIAMPPDKNVGDRWEIKGLTGKQAWKAEIQAGRADLEAIAAGIKAAATLEAAAPAGKE